MKDMKSMKESSSSSYSSYSSCPSRPSCSSCNGFSGRHLEAFFPSRGAQSFVERNEGLIVGLFFAPDEGGGELQGVGGAHRVAGEQPSGAPADVVGRRDRVGVLDERPQTIGHFTH